MTQTTILSVELDELPALERGQNFEHIKKPDQVDEDEILTVPRSPLPSIAPSVQIENTPGLRSSNAGVRIGNIFIEEKVLHLVAACVGAFAVGLNDTATGANLPSIQKQYDLTYEVVSLVFLAGFGGYLVSCMLSPVLQNKIGTCWVLLIAGVFYAGGSLLVAFAPPFPLVMAALALIGIGGGFCDACLASVVAHYEDKRSMNILYAFFGVGALCSPFVIGGLTKANIPWNRYYWLPFSLEVVIIGFHFVVFRNYEPPSEEVHQRSTMRARLHQISKKKVFWVGIALVNLGFAIVDTLTNWLTSYLIEVKGSEPDASRYQLSMLWAGLTAGRLFFSLPYVHVRDRIGNTVLLALLCGAISVLWVVDTMALDWVVIVLAGFFLGPNTPTILSIVAVRVPPSLKNAAVSITIGSGIIGSTLGPLIFGVAAGKIVPGLQVLPPVIIVLACLSALVFWAIPPREKRD